MKLKDYKEIIGKTAIYPTKVDNFGLAYSWLGLIEESEEAREAFELYVQDKRPSLKKALIKEVGDVCWYVTNIVVLENLDIEKVFAPINKNPDGYSKYFNTKSIERYAGNIKKLYRDNKEVDKDELTDVLNKHINIIMKSTQLYGLKLSEILETNYNKLIKRRETNTIQGDGDNREENL